jgi:hypothetical protein
VNGRQWRKHKTDGDRWPSDPHAVDIVTGEKLDLTTGEYYDPRTRQRVGRLSKKQFRLVLKKLKLE